MDRKTRIAVVGAGLGGLTVAGFLQRAGFATTVYEQAPTFSRIGAGIILSANATKVLRRLGLEPDLVATGIKPECYISRAWDSGATMYEIWFDAAKEERFGGTYLNVHRGDLHAVLEKGVAAGSIAFDHRLIAVEKTSDAFHLSFENGITVEADLVIGADGIEIPGPRRSARSGAAAVCRRGRPPGDLSSRAAARIQEFPIAPSGGAATGTSSPIS